MHVGRGSWAFHVRTPHRLMLALYVRDVAGLVPSASPRLPSLTPPVRTDPSIAALVDQDVAASEWGAWWRELLALGGEIDRTRLPEPREQLPELDSRPAVQTLARAVFADAARWAQARKHEARPDPPWRGGSAERQIIASVTRRRWWRRVRPFDLLITSLPVAGARGWTMAGEHVLVTHQLRADQDAYHQWLTPVIEELAWPTRRRILR